MILVFGGTTEGKQVATLLDFLNEPYFYSTKTSVSLNIKGQNISGALDEIDMVAFCTRQSVRLIIDAAHPFAVYLHNNIYKTSLICKIAVVRFERKIAVIHGTPHVRLFSSFPEMAEALQKSPFKKILSLTGVQTIPFFKSLTKSKEVFFRILNSEQSIQMARTFGIEDCYLIPEHLRPHEEQLAGLLKQIGAEVLLSKESGESGFFPSKVLLSQKFNLPLWVVIRPVLPEFNHIVYSQKQLLQQIYQLKKSVLKTGTGLRTGYTTGMCVAACVKACFIAIIKKHFPAEVEVSLPDGTTATFHIFAEELQPESASCTVIKDAGDDPDVTHGKEIGCRIRWVKEPGIHFVRGRGIGVITFPGLQLPVGEPAVNPAPRLLISGLLKSLCSSYKVSSPGFEVEPYIPEGEELAKLTFNPRVGVVGGLSVIGTSGRVIPFSDEAFFSAVSYQLSVARSLGIDEIVLTVGKRSETILKKEFAFLPEPAFIHYGNFVGKVLKEALNAGFKKINLGIMTGKAFKLAEGHLDTHSHKVIVNIDFLVNIAQQCGYPEEIIQKIKTITVANAITGIIPASKDAVFYKSVAEKCQEVCKNVLGESIHFTLFLLGDNSIIFP
jgi:cobalt-precorrin-5B (C1)-methyltransferase